MSLFNSLKKALGFPDEYDDENSDLRDDDDQQPESAVRQPVFRHPAPSEKREPQPSAPVPEISIDDELPSKIFDAVLELFNQTQPQFVRDCLNKDAQRQYLIDNISKSLKESLDKVTAEAHQRGQQQWQRERQSMNDDIEHLRSEYHQLKQQREEFQSQRLSAERQKRALNDRIRDLEGQVNTLEADREQLRLENRSMLNKLRVAAVNSGPDSPEGAAEFKRLNDEIESQKAEIKDFKEQLRKARDDEKTMSIALIPAQEKADRLQRELEDLRQEYANREFTPEQQAAMDEIEQQVKKFESILEKKNAKIQQLKDSLDASQAENLQLKDSLEASQAEVKRITQLLQASDKSTAPADEPKPAPKPESKNKKRRKHKSGADREATEKAAPATMELFFDQPEPTDEQPSADDQPKFSAIDELMDNTDWFIAPDPVPMKKDPEIEEDFGYKEPVKKTSRDDDKQLSLF